MRGRSQLGHVRRRPATAADRPFLEDVHVAALGPIALVAYGWTADRTALHFRTAIPLAQCHVILADGLPVGYFALEDRVSSWYLAAIAIAPRYQGGGLGARVLRALQIDADGLPIRLSVVHTNRARALYQRLGFLVVERDARRSVLEWREP